MFVPDLRKRLMVETKSIAIGRRRQIPEDGIGDVLIAIRQRTWMLDAWTSHWLSVALKAIGEGRYDDARLNTLAALTPPEERHDKLPDHKAKSLARLQAELATLRRTAFSGRWAAT